MKSTPSIKTESVRPYQNKEINAILKSQQHTWKVSNPSIEMGLFASHLSN